ncbi:MAG: helix-turn-helix domain-containing protein [Gemmatimonadota bacterium]
MAVLARPLRAVEAAHDRLGLSYREIADALRADESTVHRWRSGVTEPSAVFVDRLEALQELVDEARRTFRSYGVARSWLDREVPDLGGRSPRSVIVTGRLEQVTRLLLGLNLGMTG